MVLVGRLIQTVEELLDEHEKMLRVVEQKRQLLIDGDIEKLKEIVNEEMKLISKIEQLEEKRMKHGVRIATEFGLKLEELTASKLIEIDKDPQRVAKINLLTGRFVKVIGEIQTANDLNGQLIHQSLDMIQNSIATLTDPFEPGTYSGTGDSAKTANKKSLFDKSV